MSLTASNRHNNLPRVRGGHKARFSRVFNAIFVVAVVYVVYWLLSGPWS